MVLYETKVLLFSFICFCPQMSGYCFCAYDKGEPEFLLWITFCVPLVVYAILRLLHLKVAEILYSMHLLWFNIYTGYLVTNIYLSNSC